MRRAGSIAAVAFSLCFSSALVAQRGIEFHGTPASVTSPGLNGHPRGIPASVTDPTFNTRASGAAFTHGRGRGHGHRTPVYVVPYIGYYGGYYDASMYDEPQPAAAPPQVIIVKEQATESSEDSRYGEHSFDGRDSTRRSDEEFEQPKAAPAPAAKEQDDAPMTTLIYRDGHKAEVRNYAIVGSNLIDLSKSPVLKKIPLDSLDLVATRKENEDNGLDFHTP